MCFLRQIQPLLLLSLLFALRLPCSTPRKHVIEGRRDDAVRACQHLFPSSCPCSLCVTFLKRELSCILNCIIIATAGRLKGLKAGHSSRNAEMKLPYRIQSVSLSHVKCQTPPRDPQDPSHHNAFSWSSRTHQNHHWALSLPGALSSLSALSHGACYPHHHLLSCSAVACSVARFTS
jgi:hypothetical protein